MNKNERIFTKRELIIFFIIPTLFSILFVNEYSIFSTNIFEAILPLVFLSLFFNIPSILAILLNLIFKIANIENEKIIKTTKIISSIFIVLLLFLEGASIIWIFVG